MKCAVLIVGTKNIHKTQIKNSAMSQNNTSKTPLQIFCCVF